MPGFDAPEEVKEAACRAIRDGFNQYAITRAVPPLRQAVAKKTQRFKGIECDPDTNVTVCCGATECMMPDVSGFGATDDTEFVKWMIREIGVSAVPGSSLYSPCERGRTQVRLMFAKKDETLREAGQRLLQIGDRLAR